MNTIEGIGQTEGMFKEGRIARAIESRTAKIPSDLFLWAAGASIVGSLVLQMVFQGRTSTRFFKGYRSGQLSLFVGQWAPTFLMLGLYDKIVKVAGSDRVSH